MDLPVNKTRAPYRAPRRTPFRALPCALSCALFFPLFFTLFPTRVHAAYVPDPTEAALLEAVVRDEVRAYSRGDPSLIGASPSLSAANADGPEATAALAAQAAAKLKSDIIAFYQGKPTDLRVSTLAINVSMYSRLLPAGHGCPDDMDRCWQSIRAADRSSQRNEALASVLKRFKEAGLDLSPYDALGRRPGQTR